MLLSTLAVLAVVGGAPAQTERQLVDRIVAVVNEDVITLSDLEKAARPYLGLNDTAEKKQQLYRDVLEQLVAEQLMTQQIKEAKITVEDEEVDRAIKDILRQNNIDEEELRGAIESRGMSMGQYREDLKKQLVRLKIIDLKVRSRVVISDSEVKAEYDRSAQLEKREELISLRHLFFRWGESPDPAEKKRVLAAARAARDRVVKGEDFAAVAKEVSEGPTASSGGDLGEVSRNGLLPELSRAIEKLPTNQVSEPIETSNGVHVVRIDGRRAKESTAYAEVRNQIYQRLYQAEVERQMKLWVDELRAQGAVDVRL
ncbi:peptidylprolyl isomerase [Myxococcota bacterium]|nr:peptidylprolyl isomerase [Myxococcota bacterium]